MSCPSRGAFLRAFRLIFLILSNPNCIPHVQYVNPIIQHRCGKYILQRGTNRVNWPWNFVQMKLWYVWCVGRPQAEELKERYRKWSGLEHDPVFALDNCCTDKKWLEDGGFINPFVVGDVPTTLISHTLNKNKFYERYRRQRHSTFDDLFDSEENKVLTPDKNRHQISSNKNQFIAANNINMHIRELQVMNNTYKDMVTVHSSINSSPAFSPLITVPTDPHASLPSTAANPTNIPFAHNK